MRDPDQDPPRARKGSLKGSFYESLGLALNSGHSGYIRG